MLHFLKVNLYITKFSLIFIHQQEKLFSWWMFLDWVVIFSYIEWPLYLFSFMFGPHEKETGSNLYLISIVYVYLLDQSAILSQDDSQILRQNSYKIQHIALLSLRWLHLNDPESKKTTIHKQLYHRGWKHRRVNHRVRHKENKVYSNTAMQICILYSSFQILYCSFIARKWNKLTKISTASDPFLDAKFRLLSVHQTSPTLSIWDKFSSSNSTFYLTKWIHHHYYVFPSFKFCCWQHISWNVAS